jgi:hypothetical protein
MPCNFPEHHGRSGRKYPAGLLIAAGVIAGVLITSRGARLAGQVGTGLMIGCLVLAALIVAGLAALIGYLAWQAHAPDRLALRVPRPARRLPLRARAGLAAEREPAALPGSEAGSVLSGVLIPPRTRERA